MYYAIYFSPTFNTEAACKYFCDGEYKSIDLTKNIDNISLSSDDIAVIGVPSYSGRAPELALKRLMAIKGNGARAILISSYGNRASEDTLIELMDECKKLGFKIVCGMELVGRHSIFTEVAKNRPDGLDYRDYASFKIEILNKLKANKADDFKMPGNRPYREVSPSKLIPLTLDSCVGCGDCVRMCPAGAIDSKDPSKIDPNKCAHCMRCIEICHFNAKVLDENIIKPMSERLAPKFEGRKPNNLYI